MNWGFRVRGKPDPVDSYGSDGSLFASECVCLRDGVRVPGLWFYTACLLDLPS